MLTCKLEEMVGSTMTKNTYMLTCELEDTGRLPPPASTT